MKKILAIWLVLLGVPLSGLRADPLRVIPIPEIRPATISDTSDLKQSENRSRSIVVRGREAAVVTASEYRLADVAEVISRSTRDDEAVIALQKVVLGKSPAPGQEITISAQQVLTALRDAGVDAQKIGYAFPRVMRVSRAARTISEEEVRAALLSFFTKSGRKAQIRELDMPRDVKVSPQVSAIDALPLTVTQPGRQTFQMVIKEDGQEVRSFDVRAALDEWLEMPVARRPLARGTIIGPEDVVMARMNSATLPRDVNADGKTLVGMRASQDINAGELFRRQQLTIPPVVEAGSRVTLVYRSGALEATATGIAIEGGAQGDIINVRNEVSKRVVSGTVTEPGVVQVQP